MNTGQPEGEARHNLVMGIFNGGEWKMSLVLPTYVTFQKANSAFEAPADQ